MWRTIRRGETWHGEVCNRNKAGDIYWVDTTVVPVQGPDGKILRYVSTRYDITDRKRSELELERLALTDGLTGLANRTRLLSMLKELLATEDGCGLIALIDLDHFKSINDGYGHLVGDEVLKEVVVQIKKCIRQTDICFRYGGEEFVLLMPGALPGKARAKAEWLRQRYSEVAAQAFPEMGVLTLSVGISEAPANRVSFEQLYLAADKALYQAKENGRNCCEEGGIQPLPEVVSER